MKDGSRIYRKNGEPICDAADRLRKPQVNFITYTAQIRPEEDSHDEYEESEGGDSEYEIYPVTRSQKSITERRKEVLTEFTFRPCESKMHQLSKNQHSRDLQKTTIKYYSQQTITQAQATETGQV